MQNPVYVPHNRGPNIQEVVDGCCDIRVVTTGTLSAFGIADEGPQEAVDESNLAKFKTPICSECGNEMRFGQDDTFGKFYSCMNPAAKHGYRRVSVATIGGYKREDGKWIKPTTWKAPNWDTILLEQGYIPANAVVVNTEAVPVGPGDGLRHRLPIEESPTDRAVNGAAPIKKKYDGHLCPHCKNPVGDEVVKQLDQGKIKYFRCAACSGYFRLTNNSLIRIANQL